VRGLFYKVVDNLADARKQKSEAALRTVIELKTSFLSAG
jgi:hypothetical protein